MNRILPSIVFMLLSMSSIAQIDYSKIHSGVANISSSELINIVSELAEEKYQGRLTGTPEYFEASKYLAEQFNELGLKPGAKNNEWFQYFDQAYTLVNSDCSLELILPQKKAGTIIKSYSYFDEFIPGSTSASGEVSAEVIFVGWGISAEELNFDEYKGLDVAGKIVLMRPESPVSPSAGEKDFLPWLKYSTHQYKMQNALDHGAIGVLYHYGPLVNTNNAYHEGLINSLVGSQVVSDLFEGTGKDYSTLVGEIKEKLEPRSFALGKTVRIKNSTIHFPEGKGNNVLGLIEGSDPDLKDEVIIIGAHLDHVGACYEVCPGAQDNASGIAAIYGVAKALIDSDIVLKRSVLFIGFGAEEQGLTGSKHYINNPVYPLDKTVCMLNLDCVGVGPNFHAGAGQNYPEIFSAVKRANDRYIHRKLSSSFSSNLGRPRSDASIFMRAGVPALSFSSNGGKGYYHNPLDRVETIWPETLEAIAGIMSYTIVELANTETEEISGPKNGHLIIAGGALSDSSVFARFVELAGGENAKIVVIPTASDDNSLNGDGTIERFEKSFAKYGIPKVSVLHTRDRKEANDYDFVNHLKDASGVWFFGGRQWRLADTYLNTASHDAMNELLERGGVIGGSSAGATIQGSYLFRGDTKTNTILCGDHEEGLSFINNVAIDQHVIARNRQFDMFEALEKYPGMLGIGLDENTAIEVHGSQFKVIGQHYVLVYDGKFFSRDRGGYVELTRGAYPFYLLKPGEEYDLKSRELLRGTRR